MIQEIEMLELIAIAFGALLAASLLVWIYRRISSFKGVSHRLVSLSRQQSSRHLARQMGFLKGNTQARRSQAVKQPWGW